MINSRGLASKLALRPDEEYFAGCLGFAILISGIGEWIHSGSVPSWMPQWFGFTLACIGLGVLQALTLVGLRRHLASLGRSYWWTGLLLTLWIGFDLPLIATRGVYLILPLAYGISQAAFLFNLRKADGPDPGNIANSK